MQGHTRGHTHYPPNHIWVGQTQQEKADTEQYVSEHNANLAEQRADRANLAKQRAKLEKEHLHDTRDKGPRLSKRILNIPPVDYSNNGSKTNSKTNSKTHRGGRRGLVRKSYYRGKSKNQRKSKKSRK